MTDTTQATRALIEEAKRYHSATPDRLRCAFCLGTWPCLVSRLAAALEAAQADTQGNVTAAVLQAVRSERERQDTQWGGPEHDDGHWPDDWRRFRQRFERKAQHALDGRDSQAARAALVKIAALAVAQIESLSRAEPDTEEEDTDHGK